MHLGGQARVILGVRWVGRRDDLDFNEPLGSRRVTLDPYTHVNVAVEYTLPLVQFNARVQNAFDDRSPEIASYQPRGRTIMLGARFMTGL